MSKKIKSGAPIGQISFDEAAEFQTTLSKLAARTNIKEEDAERLSKLARLLSCKKLYIEEQGCFISNKLT